MFSLLVILLEYEDACDWVCVTFHTLTVNLWLAVMILRTSGSIHVSGLQICFVIVSLKDV